MPGRWLPWPGKRKATGPPDEEPAAKIPSWASLRSCRATGSLRARSSRLSATRATWTGAVPRVAATPAARSPSRRGRPAASFAAKVAASPSMATTAVGPSVPRKQNSSAGHASTPNTGPASPS